MATTTEEDMSEDEDIIEMDEEGGEDGGLVKQNPIGVSLKETLAKQAS
jgi:hypothetical protein